MYTQSDDIRHNLVQAAGLRASTRGQTSPTNVNTRNKPNTNPKPINQSARSRRRRLSGKSWRDRVKNTSIKNSLKWAYVRGAVRPALALISATSRRNLNLTPPLYTSSSPPTAPPPLKTHPLLRTHVAYIDPSCSRWNLATLKIRAWCGKWASWRAGRRGRQSAGRTWANKIDFLSARYDASWRHCLLLPLKCGHRFFTEYPDETLHESDFIDLETLTFFQDLWLQFVYKCKEKKM